MQTVTDLRLGRGAEAMLPARRKPGCRSTAWSLRAVRVAGWLAVVATGLGDPPLASAGFPRGRLPDYEVRFKLTPLDAKDAPPDGYAVTIDKSTIAINAAAGEWSDFTRVTDADLNGQSSTYPNSESRTWPARIMHTVKPVTGPVRVEVEVKVDGRRDSSDAELHPDAYGSAKLGFAVMMDWEKKGLVMTLSTYNRRVYWDEVRKAVAALPPAIRDLKPAKIVLADEFRQGDRDVIGLREGVAGLREMGMNALYLVSDVPGGPQAIAAAGYPFLAGAVYQPPGILDAGSEATSDAGLERWAAGLAARFPNPRLMSLYVMSDEPGWYYPSEYENVNGNSDLLARFHAFLRDRGLGPADVGARDWGEVRMTGRSTAAGDLPARRLFYWSQRFVPHESARHFARCASALERAFHPDMAIAVNWNFFAGRSYSPGGFGNNPQRNHPDSAMAGHDWFEFGRLRGGTCLWTEDWFDDELGYQWPFFADRLRSASPTGSFGGYIVPRQAGTVPDGLVYRTLALVGHGAKHVKYFAFGPEYEFPGNCWSQRGVIAPIVKATRLVAAAEDLLHPGKPVAPEVGILQHLSAQMWDSTEVVDATNSDMNARCAAYTAEAFNLYLALSHRQVPVGFVSEEDILGGGLDRLKVLYVTEPNIPAEAQRRIADWVRGGGVLMTTSGAGGFDRYNTPCEILDEVRGVVERDAAARMVFGRVIFGPMPDTQSGPLGSTGCAGGRGQGTVRADDVELLSRFQDGSPATTRRRQGKGLAYHAAWLPGMSYYRTFTPVKGGFLEPSSGTPSARSVVLAPIEAAGVRRPVEVDRPLIGAPALVSDQGVAVTLLNWTGTPQKDLKVRVRTERAARSVTTALGVPIAHTTADGEIEATLDLDTVDVLLVRY